MKKTIWRVLLCLTVISIALSACGPKGLTWQEQYDLGVRYFEDGNYEEAIIAFTAAIEIDPKQADAYRSLAEIYIKLGDYESAVNVLEQGTANTEDASLQDLLGDARKLASIDFENLVSDVFSYIGSGELADVEYHIPQINLDDPEVLQLNRQIYEELKYDQIESDIAEMGFPAYYASYEWAVNGDILSLVVENTPTLWDGTIYYVYNISILRGIQVSNEEVIASAGFTMTDYYTRSEQALGSKFWEGWDRNSEGFLYNAQNPSFCEMFNVQLENTISSQNVQCALPYINSDGQLCIVAPVYSMAGADYYYDDLNLMDFIMAPDYNKGLEVHIPQINISQEDAYQIACDYWNFTPGDIAEETGFELFVTYDTTLTVQRTGKTYYCYLLRWMVDEGTDTAHLSTCDWVYIDAESGECTFNTPK